MTAPNTSLTRFESFNSIWTRPAPATNVTHKTAAKDQHFAGAVVLHDGEDAHEGNVMAGSCLRGVLTQPQKRHHGWHENEAASHANKSGGNAGKQADGQEGEQGKGVGGMGQKSSSETR